MAPGRRGSTASPPLAGKLDINSVAYRTALIRMIGRRWQVTDLEDQGARWVVYIASIRDSVYVLHAFQKKTQQTVKRDLGLAAMRLKLIISGTAI
jgi:phage-related protein